MREHSFLSLGPHGFHRIAYTEWGNPDNAHVVVCVHGLTRNARDFDFLAAALQSDCRVVCPDMPGRGNSERLGHAEDYNYTVYVADMAALLARLGAGGHSKILNLAAKIFGRVKNPIIDWVGTSMGGLIGMMIAAQPKSPIRRLVMNDVGPLVPAAALRRLGEYVGKDPQFASLEEFEAYVRKVSSPFGPLTDAQWRHLALHSVKQHEDGRYGFKYDPAIGAPLKATIFQDVELWSFWENVRCPVLILRGAESDLLLRETAEKMCKREAPTQLVELPGIGHAPMLMTDDQIKIVRDFLLASD
ncbi:MAG TPA: alpha/beta hydrolase [Burkholderiales bacterium]|nr:alpha/beta hydrolase [Burkholderiales bacterium]